MRTALVIAVVGAGCALVGRQAPSVAPLESEGELVVEAEAAQPELSAVLAVRDDGAQTPLRLLISNGAEIDRPRMWARGRLEPGHYSGLALVPPKGEAQRISAPFSIARRHATVLALPQATVPARTLTQLVSYVTSADAHEIDVVDKLSRRLDEVIPVGRSPWGVALDPVGGRAYVALEGEDQIAVIDIATGEAQNRIRLNLGDGPREIALTPDRRTLLCANAGSNTVSFIDAQGMIETARTPVGQEPTSILVDRRGLRAYVTNSRSSSISVLDLGTRAVAGTIATDDRPLRPQLDRTGSKLYVLHPASAFLLVISLPDLAVLKRVWVGAGNSGLKVDAATDLIYVAKSGERRISVYDPFSLIPVAGIDAVEGASYMAIDDAENALFALSADAAQIGVVELAHKKLAAVVDVGGSPRVLAIAGERN